MRTIIINTFFLRIRIISAIYAIKFDLVIKEVFQFLILLAHHLSKIKYHIAFANGSTIASVNAIVKDTSAINIRTVIAIIKLSEFVWLVLPILF